MKLRLANIIALLSHAIALCGIAPLFPWVAAVPRLALVAGMVAGIIQDRRGAWPIKTWIFNAAVVPVVLFYFSQASRTNVVQPVVSVLALMLAVRLAGEKSVRHYLQIQALSLFCLASSSLFDLSPSFLVWLALLLLLVAVSLVLLTFHTQDAAMILSRSDLRRIVTAGLLLPLFSLPLMLFFFPVLPRTQFPLWNFIAAPTVRTSGYSDRVEPGISSSLAESRVLVFRAETPRLPNQELYWRATVFNRIEGQRWVRDGTVPTEQVLYRGARTVQTIYPEPGSSRILPGLDAPASLTLQRLRTAADVVFEYQGPVTQRLAYRVESVTSGLLATAGGIDRAFYLKLPPNLPERITRLATDIRRRGTSDARRLELLEQYFRTAGYRYSRRGLPTGDHALERFLFEQKQGHCEFFASGFALLLRGAGIPARLVGGYLGGEYNELGGYYQISDDMAHVWVEAYLEGRGWLRVDPSSFARNAGELWGTERGRSFGIRLRLLLDSLNHRWNRAIVTYDFERQVEAVRTAGLRLQGVEPKRLLREASPWLMTATGAIALWWLLVRYGLLLPASREKRLLRRFHRQVGREFGLVLVPGHQGLFEIATLTGSDRVREFAEIYAGAVYRDRRLTADEARRLEALLSAGFAPPGQLQQQRQ
jgi:transglutaminase-like putative cysteine protease